MSHTMAQTVAALRAAEKAGDALKIKCPLCGAGPGRLCVTREGSGQTLLSVHETRKVVAEIDGVK